MPEKLSDREKYLLRVEGFNLDIVLQLCELRKQRHLTQAELAALIGTKQQSVSRMESPGYDRHSLATLRQVAEHLGAYLDVVLVPEEKLEKYLEYRYQPVIAEQPPEVVEWQTTEAVTWNGYQRETFGGFGLVAQRLESGEGYSGGCPDIKLEEGSHAA